MFRGKLPELGWLRESFEERYEQLFGYKCPRGHALEVVMVRVIASEEQGDQERESFGEARQVYGLLRANYCTILAGEGWQVSRREWRESFVREGDRE